MRSLAAVKGQVESLGTLLPNKLGDYLVRSAKVLDGLPDDQQKGQKLAKVLFDGVGVLDQLERAKVWSRHLEAIRSKIDPVRTAVAEFLGREHNLGFVPSVGTSQVSRGSQPDGVDVRWLRAPVAPGTVLWTESRGYRSGETVQGRGAVVVADEGGSDLRARLIEVWRAIESDGGTDSRADLEKMSRWIDELVDGEDRSEANTARHAFNLIHTRNASGQHANLIKWLLAFLGKHGVYEIPVTLGKPFDSSFSPSKFERRQERSNRPVGTILRVMTPGLVDREGLALQKAVLAVSSGGE